MNELRFYKTAFILCMILNSALLAVVFFGRPGHRPPHPADLKHEMIRELHLDRNQADAFHRLASGHHEAMLDNQAQQRELLRNYFKPLADGSAPVQQDSLLEAIQALERQQVVTTYQHFEDVKNLLNENQKKDFPTFLRKAMDILLLNNDEPRQQPPMR
jgi:hypothetical protein